MLNAVLRTILWIGLVSWAAPVVAAGEDPVVLRADALRVELPLRRSVSVSGSGQIELHEGRSVLLLPEGAQLVLNGEPVTARAEAHAGDSVVVREQPGGALLWSLEVGELSVVNDSFAAFRSALGVQGDGVGGAFSADGAAASPVVIGVTTAPPDSALAAQLGVAPDQSLRVLEVSPGLPAAAAGVQPHDVIVAIDGRAVVTKASLRELIATHAPGEHVALSVLRRGERVELRVPVIARADAERAQVDRERERLAHDLRAVELERALNDHEVMQVQLQQRLAQLESEQLQRELLLPELHVRVEQRHDRVAELHDRTAALESEAQAVQAQLAGLTEKHASYQGKLARLEQLQHELDLTRQRADSELAGLQAVQEDMLAVELTLEEAASRAHQQRAELQHVHAAMQRLLDARAELGAGAGGGLAFVESSEGSEALLMAESLAAYQRALAGEQRGRAELERRQAEQVARERARVESEHALRLRDAELARELAEAARREAELARVLAAEQANHAALQAQHAREPGGFEGQLPDALRTRLDDLQARLERIEELLERLLASAPN